MNHEIKSGLVSVSFRRLTVEQIVDLCVKAKTAGIEWGGVDEHAPPGDGNAAQRVARLTKENGLEVAGYGSYYRAGVSAPDEFDLVLDSALALEAPAIRVWAGHGPHHYADEAGKGKVVEDLERICELAGRRGLRVCTEKHGGSLTHPDSSHAWLIRQVRHPAFRTLWQPPHHLSVGERLDSLKLCLPLLENLHVFHWHPTPEDKCPLEAGASDWKQYLDMARGHARYALLEFFIDDSPEQFLIDAASLNRLLETQ